MTPRSRQDLSPSTAPASPRSGAIASVPVRLVLRPGQRGTKHLGMQFGDELVAVRYRYDLEQRVRYKTVELIVEQKPWQPREVVTGTESSGKESSGSVVNGELANGEVAPADRLVEILALGQRGQKIMREAGAQFVPARGLWRLPLTRVRAIHLVHRIVDAEHEFRASRRVAG